MSRWILTSPTDLEAREVANRHYSRQKPASKRFVQAGSCMVLKHRDAQGNMAVWVTMWPIAEYVLHRWPTAWSCAMMRNESSTRTSDLITDAIACTRWYYGKPPDLGMITFVQPDKVIEKELPGYCFLRAKFRYEHDADGSVAKTADGKKICMRITPARMPPSHRPDTSEASDRTIETALHIRLNRMAQR